MYVIGITGPTGAGKTTALRVLADMGGQVIDCDAVYHRLLESDGALLGRIEAAFPGVVKDWSLDRKALGARVYGDPEGLKRLTELTWPAVRREVERQLKNRRHPSTGLEAGPPPLQTGEVSPALAEFAVIDAIGLFESGLSELCDLTVAVVAEEAVRVRRLMERDGISENYARARIAAQKPAEWFAGQAELVLENNGTEAEFAEKCRAEFGKRLPAMPIE
ncbi:MAG: dephospho-CoA kinase [Oscillospiraceae bacterium]|nr:dephospho-CoA kinase [Oscillospiraceae bacterium]